VLVEQEESELAFVESFDLQQAELGVAAD